MVSSEIRGWGGKGKKKKINRWQKDEHSSVSSQCFSFPSGPCKRRTHCAWKHWCVTIALHVLPFQPKQNWDFSFDSSICYGGWGDTECGLQVSKHERSVSCRPTGTLSVTQINPHARIASWRVAVRRDMQQAPCMRQQPNTTYHVWRQEFIIII